MRQRDGIYEATLTKMIELNEIVKNSEDWKKTYPQYDQESAQT